MRATVVGVAVLATLVLFVGPIGGSTALTASPDAEAGEPPGVAIGVQESNETGAGDGAGGDDANDAGAGANGTCDYVGLYDETIPAIVQVQVRGTGSNQGSGSGLGSGFVFERANGTSHVVTNQHVVRDRDSVTVQFSDGTARDGEVVGTDVYSDLAVVAVEDAPEAVESLPVADAAPEPGERVAALGSPFGLEGTITAGIVSAVDRSMSTTQGFSIPNTVQTDAPINPGNSGGPLVTCEGDVVGVNRAGGGQNIGFAIGTSLIEDVVPALIEEGSYDHSYLGVGTQGVTPALAQANDLENASGVYVHRVVPDGPAADALQGTSGVETVDGVSVPVDGDVIVAIDDQRVRSGEELGSYVATETEPGDEVELTVVRDGERTTVTVTLGERPEPGTQ